MICTDTHQPSDPTPYTRFQLDTGRSYAGHRVVISYVTRPTAVALGLELDVDVEYPDPDLSLVELASIELDDGDHFVFFAWPCTPEVARTQLQRLVLIDTHDPPHYRQHSPHSA